MTNVPFDAMAQCTQRPNYQSLRFEEDWSFLADPACATEVFDRLKYLSTGATRHQYVSLGADVRVRYERFEHPNFGAEIDDTDGYRLQRYLFHSDWHFNRALRFFAQMQSSLIDGRRAGARATDRDSLDVEQAFGDFTSASEGSDFFTLRLGRQEIEFGSARLVTARDSLNDRQSFDGARVIGSYQGLRYGGWLTRPVLTRPDAFDDGTDNSQTFSGAYFAFSHAALQGGNFAAAYVGRRRDHVTYDQGSGFEDRDTFLLRSWSRGKFWDHNWEVGAQTGQFADGSIRAWYLATDTGYTQPDWRFRPRLGVRADVTSGDSNRLDKVLGTFNPLYPATAFSGLAGLIGPSNTVDFAPSLTLSLNDSVSVTMGAITFWRQRREDGIYGIGGNLLRTGQRSSARHIGNQYTLQMNWTVNRHVSVLATAAYFEAGRFLKETPPGEDVTYFTTWVNLRF